MLLCIWDDAMHSFVTDLRKNRKHYFHTIYSISSHSFVIRDFTIGLDCRIELISMDIVHTHIHRRTRGAHTIFDFFNFAWTCLGGGSEKLSALLGVCQVNRKWIVWRDFDVESKSRARPCVCVR